nr:unnamed protein product [Callosobruchus chinensis]
MNNSIQTYSSALVQPAHKYPNKEQAIIFNAIGGARIQDYLLQLGPIINPKNILFCSRISNNRLCVYLSSKAWVDKFLADPGEIVIQGEKVRARRLVTSSDRLVISNVCPTIPNTAIKSALEQLDLQLLSPISFLRIGATLPEYSHILSFRRVTYVAPNESTKIPESIEINHEGLKYRIFLSLDSQKCFKCKKGGHIAAQCPTTILQSTIPAKENSSASSSPTEETSSPTEETSSPTEETSLPTEETSPPTEETSSPIEETSKQHDETTEQSQKQEIRSTPQTKSRSDVDTNTAASTSKRGFSETLTPENESISDNTTGPIFVKPKDAVAKKLRADSSLKLSPGALESLAAFMENNQSSLTINSTQLISLLENVHGTQDVITVVKDYTSDIKGLTETLLMIYPHIPDKTITNRCTRLRKKLERYLDSTADDHLSDTSSTNSTF